MCEAVIQQKWRSIGRTSTASTPSVEERVDVSEDALEAIHRAILSHTDCNLTVLEMILSMPWIPCSSHGTVSGSVASSWNTCLTDTSAMSSRYLQGARDRAVLRLLEDALFDACEREGEEEMLDDLTLHDQKNENDESHLEMHDSNSGITKGEQGGSAGSERNKIPNKKQKRVDSVSIKFR